MRSAGNEEEFAIKKQCYIAPLTQWSNAFLGVKDGTKGLIKHNFSDHYP